MVPHACKVVSRTFHTYELIRESCIQLYDSMSWCVHDYVNIWWYLCTCDDGVELWLIWIDLVMVMKPGKHALDSVNLSESMWLVIGDYGVNVMHSWWTLNGEYLFEWGAFNLVIPLMMIFLSILLTWLLCLFEIIIWEYMWIL